MILQQRQGKQVKCLIESIWVVINRALTHTHPNPPTLTHNHPHLVKKNIISTHIHPHPTQKGQTHLGHPAVNR